jgi:glycine/D-amino acid oxidase-like deaminating enzyme
LRQIADTAGITGLPVEFLSDSELHEVFPALERTESVKAALWSPTDGYLQPNSLVTAYVGAARNLGVTVATHAAVTGIGVRAGAIESVSTESGTYRTAQVIIAAGPWSAALARLVGLDLPIVPVLHEYFVTEPVTGWHADLPCLRIPEVQVYARGENNRVLCGGFEHTGTSIDPRQVTVASSLAARPDWDVLGGFAQGLSVFAPSVADAGIAATFQGWPGFSPDGRFIVGPTTAIRGLAFAAACNAHGVSGSAGLAMNLVESLAGDPSPYVRSLSPDRFIPRTWSWEDARSEAQAVYENYYPMPAAT